MSEQYPFPLPEAIQNEANEVIERLGPHPGGYLWFPPGYPNPQCLNALKNCHSALSVIYDAIDLAASEVSGKVGRECEKETSLLYTVTNALETELDRMEQVLKWGYLTWKHDPAIQAVHNSDTIPPTPKPETSPEAAPARN